MSGKGHLHLEAVAVNPHHAVRGTLHAGETEKLLGFKNKTIPLEIIVWHILIIIFFFLKSALVSSDKNAYTSMEDNSDG